MNSDWNPPSDEIDNIEVRKKLFELRQSHRELEDELSGANPTDQFTISRIKRLKLALKDQIRFYENQLHPDIIA